MRFTSVVKSSLVALGAFCVLCLSFLSVNVMSHEGATGIVEERMERFKQNKADLGEIRLALRKDDKQLAHASALKMIAWGGVMAEHFPAGSNPYPSETLDRVWEEWPTFEKQIERYTASAQTMADLIEQDAPKASLDKAFKQLGRTCKVCHNRYKAN